MGVTDSKPAPQLTFGKPFDPSADVPLFPPGAMMATVMTGRLLAKLTGKQLFLRGSAKEAPEPPPEAADGALNEDLFDGGDDDDLDDLDFEDDDDDATDDGEA